MKRLGLLAFSVLFTVSVFGVFSSSKVFAQAPDAAQQQQLNQQNNVSGPTVVNSGPGLLNDAQATAAVTPPNATPSATPSSSSGKKSDCGFFSPISCVSDVWVWIIKTLSLNIAGFFLWLAANMFNYAVKAGVLNFSEWATGLYPMWLMVRQIISLIIVFVGLYLGFLYIIGKDGLQKFAPWFIMFALFVNFSYPLVRTAIDISNVISLNIYASVVGADALDKNADATGGGLIVSKLGLQGLVASASKSGSSDLLKSINTVPAALIAVCYVFYASYIFFMVTMLFVIRTAALVFLIVASPLLLVDSVLPVLGDKAKKLREIFFAQLAVGPIFMIMFALTVRFLDVFSASGVLSTNQLGTVTTGDQTISSFFNILMMLVLLWIMLKVTKIASGSAGEFMTNAVGTVGSYAVGAATGGVAAGTGLLARRSLGAIAAKARDSKWVEQRQNTVRGRLAYNLSNSVASSTFDVRNTATAQKYAGKLGISSGMGAGVKMGFDEESRKKVEAVAARGARIKTKIERDIIKNGQVVARKGETDKEGVAALERFHQNNGGALFLTKKQKDDLAGTFVEEAGSKELSEYKKKPSKEAKQLFVGSINKELSGLQQAGQGSSPRAQALMRTIYDIAKQEKEDKEAFDLQLVKEIDKYRATSDAKKQDYLARLDKDMREAVVKATSPEPTQEPEVVAKPASTGATLRQERIQKVAEGRANNVEKIRNEIQTNNENTESYEARRQEVLTNYNNDLASVMANAPTSNSGKPLLSPEAQSQISELDRKRDENLKFIDKNVTRNDGYAQNDAELLAKNEAKQQKSADKATIFAENRNQNAPAAQQEKPDVVKIDYAAQFASNRKKAQADAQIKVNESFKSNTASGGAVDTSKPAANQTPFTAKATA